MIKTDKPVNQKRRNLLQGAALVGAASFAPAVFGGSMLDDSSPALTGKLICKISDPIKTLVLRNNTSQTMVIEQVSDGALMFDGSIVDCNAACLNKPISISPHQEVHVKFDKRRQFSLAHKIEDFQRIQSRVTRLSDGTRVIPFSAKLQGRVATVV